MSIGSLALNAGGVVPLWRVRGERVLGRWGRVLFLCTAAYLVVPVFDVPYWGLSFSTPVLLLLALEVGLRDGSRFIQEHFGWLLLALMIWVGQYLSLAGNVFLAGMQQVGGSSFLWLLKYAFWMGVFLLTLHVVAKSGMAARLSTVLAVAVIALGAVRVGEGLLLGAVGSAESVMLQQNNYGWAFSTFAPFAVWLAFAGPGKWRWGGVGGLGLLAAAIAITGSRASWVGVSVGVLISLIGLMLWSPRNRRGIVLSSIAVCLSVGTGWAVAPESWRMAVEQRWKTLESLERDKSYAVRMHVSEKAWALFESSPWFGSGVGSFREQSVAVDLPAVLRHRAADAYQRKSSHNAYLGLLAESGVVGLLPMAVLLVALGIRGVVSVRRRALGSELWPVAVLAGFVGMCLHLAMLSGLTNTATWFVFGVMAGVISGTEVAQERAD